MSSGVNVFTRFLRTVLGALLGIAGSLALLAIADPNYGKLLLLAQTRYGTKAEQTVKSWQEMMRAAESMSEVDKVKRVNEFFNRVIQFGEDQAIWGENDYWATPLELMGRGIGDCEDFAIAKYFALRSLNVPNERLRITYVKARIGGPRSDVMQAHMILGYYEDPAGDPVILDNLITEVRPATRRGDLMPIFSFNSEGLWTGAGPAEKKDTSSSTARLSRWRDLIARMQAEGYE
ncbi:MAG: transglutaminase-like cysteine peptidase [Rhodocyclaceae bacterium]|nr:transglutaminase-like cysteine peptidase [Rhodocyclaceae bacterium]